MALCYLCSHLVFEWTGVLKFLSTNSCQDNYYVLGYCSLHPCGVPLQGFSGILPLLMMFSTTGMFFYFEFWLLYFFPDFEIVLFQPFHVCSISHHSFFFLSKNNCGETWLTLHFYFYQAIWPLALVLNYWLWSNICRFHWEESLFP